MSLREDLVVVNAALRDLVRLQLAGELDPTSAWQERRQLLESVDAIWERLPEDVEAMADTSANGAVGESRLTSPWKWPLTQRRLSWPVLTGMILLLIALATLSYVASL